MASKAMYLDEITEKMFNNSALVNSNIARSKDMKDQIKEFEKKKPVGRRKPQ